jgi:NitT/TauT family transport system substrate-binding protein
MYAQQLGYYREAGLDVTINQGTGSVTTADEVAAGKSDMGLADAPSAMGVIAAGGALEIVAPILQTNAYSIMSLKASNITSVKDLAGKTIALQPGTAQTALLNAIFAVNGMTASQVSTESVASSAIDGVLLGGNVTAILAGADTQAPEMEATGAQLNQLMYDAVGAPTIGLSILANEHFVQTDPGAVAAFVDASLKGWAAAKKDPSAAAQAVFNQFPSAGTEAEFLVDLKVDLPHLCSAAGATHIGAVPTAAWEKTYKLLTTYDQLPTVLPLEDYYTTEFEPKDAPTCG